MTRLLGKTKDAEISTRLANELVEEGFGFLDDEEDPAIIVIFDDVEEECFDYLSKRVEASNEYT